MKRVINRGLEALNWGMAARGISPVAFRILLCLCARVDGSDDRNDYLVWPDNKTLAQDAEISESSIKRYITELVGLQLLTVHPWQTASGARTGNSYTLMVHGEATEIIFPKKREGQPFEKAMNVRLGQSDLGGKGADLTQGLGQPDGGAQVTADLCSELLKGTTELEDKPPTTFGSGTPTLFGNSNELVVASKMDLTDYVQQGFETLAQDFPRIQVPRVMNDSRKRAIAARAREVTKNSDGVLDEYAVWDLIFGAIRNNQFLRGQAEPTHKYPTPFSLSIDYLLRPKEFLRTLEKAEIDGRDHQATHNAAGRRYGPAERSLRQALARMGISR